MNRFVPVVRFVEFQAAWWATALLARAGHGWLAVVPSMVVVFVHVLRSRQQSASLLLAFLGCVVGVAVDGALARLGHIAFPPALQLEGAAWAAPFMVGLWAAFAVTLETSLSALASRPALGIVVGALGGALAYRGGASLDVLRVGEGATALAAVALAWGVATPLLGLAATSFQGEAAARRARTVPRLFATGLVFFATAPLLLLLATLVDVVRFALWRRPFMSLRLLAFGTVYLCAELVGVIALGATALAAPLSAEDLIARTYAVQAAWAGVLFGAVKRIFRLGFVVDGDERAVPGPAAGPLVVLVRHASIIDTLLPSVFITRRHGLKLRFVLKNELLEDPCLDIAGTRLPNHFVSRRAEGTERDLAAIAALGSGMGPEDGALIYPEGTRFTEAKRKRVLDELTAKDPALAARAAAMTKVLPPKPAGAFALLDASPAADAVFVAHAGLEGFASVADIWSGALLGRTVRVSMWRVPRSQIPADRAARTAWLYAEWARVDAFVAAASEG